VAQRFIFVSLSTVPPHPQVLCVVKDRIFVISTFMRLKQSVNGKARHDKLRRRSCGCATMSEAEKSERLVRTQGGGTSCLESGMSVHGETSGGV